MFLERQTDQCKSSKIVGKTCGKARVVDLGGTAEEMEGKIRTVTLLTREEEVHVTNGSRRETWKDVAAMEDGRMIAVTGMMRGGMGKRRAKKDWNPWNTPSI